MKHLWLSIAVLALVFNISCSSKDKKEGTDEQSGAVAGEEIESKALEFNAAGSDSGQIDGLSTIHFDYDRATLTQQARQELKDNAKWINDHKDISIQIEGHCDQRGSVQYNLALGERRAKAVKDYLVSLGVSSNRLSVISYGKEKTLEEGDSEMVYAKNRRANFVPMPK